MEALNASLHKKLSQKLDPLHLSIKLQASGEGEQASRRAHICVISRLFDGLEPAMRHKMVLDAIGSEVKQLSGLSLTAKSPQEG